MKHTEAPGFYITRKSGFHITLKNGWTVSVQFGGGSYSDNHDAPWPWDDVAIGENGSSTAECAVWPRGGEMQSLWGDDTVSKLSSPDEVLALLNWAASQPAEIDVKMPRGQDADLED